MGTRRCARRRSAVRCGARCLHVRPSPSRRRGGPAERRRSCPSYRRSTMRLPSMPAPGTASARRADLACRQSMTLSRASLDDGTVQEASDNHLPLATSSADTRVRSQSTDTVEGEQPGNPVLCRATRCGPGEKRTGPIIRPQLPGANPRWSAFAPEQTTREAPHDPLGIRINPQRRPGQPRHPERTRREGWELVSLIQGRDTGQILYVFKRPRAAEAAATSNVTLLA